jgi:uncharacterized protein with gpF-like domain
MAVKKKPFKPSSAAENAFAKQLRKVARASSHLVDAHVDGHKIHNPKEMQKALEDYSKLIEPWARRQSAKLLEQINKANKKSYKAKHKEMAKQSNEIGRLLREQVAENDVGAVAFALMKEQVTLITSIPPRAGERAQALALEAFYNGTRADEIAQELARTCKVTEGVAMRIARTEAARANASITQARGTAVGAQGYIWRTTLDGAERESHKKMNGKYVAYSENGGKGPHLDDGTQGHAGTLINCRCYQDVQFDSDG